MLRLIKTKIEGLTRLVMVKGLSRAFPLYIVTEYPKSGGSWVSQMLSGYLNVPFPRNRFPRFQSSIMHGHYRYFPTMNNVFVVLRDGRDVMVSFYYHCLFEHDRFNAHAVRVMRRRLLFEDYDDINGNLPRFMEYVFSLSSFRRFTWSEFVNSWIDRDAPAFIRYENLLVNPLDEMGEAIRKVCGVEPDRDELGRVVEKYSFKRQSKREPGQEDRHSYLRKGIAGDWKNHFTREARLLFNRLAGRELIRLGYEEDESWVERDTL